MAAVVLCSCSTATEQGEASRAGAARAGRTCFRLHGRRFHTFHFAVFGFSFFAFLRSSIRPTVFLFLLGPTCVRRRRAATGGGGGWGKNPYIARNSTEACEMGGGRLEVRLPSLLLFAASHSAPVGCQVHALRLRAHRDDARLCDDARQPAEGHRFGEKRSSASPRVLTLSPQHAYVVYPPEGPRPPAVLPSRRAS